MCHNVSVVSYSVSVDSVCCYSSQTDDEITKHQQVEQQREDAVSFVLFSPLIYSLFIYLFIMKIVHKVHSRPKQ